MRERILLRSRIAYRNRNMKEVSSLLSSWQPEVPEAPAFRRNVWQRIAVVEARSKSRFARWVESFLVSMAQPRLAFPVAGVAIAMGIAVGSALPARNETQAMAYLRSINPYAHVASRS
jgi:hypothetical protein